jgi:hypothetical protein
MSIHEPDGILAIAASALEALLGIVTTAHSDL